MLVCSSIRLRYCVTVSVIVIAFELLSDPVAMIEIVDVPAGVVGAPAEVGVFPPQAETMSDDASPAINTVTQSKRRAGGPSRFLFQKRIRPVMHAGSPMKEASSVDVPEDDPCSNPTMPAPSVVIVIVVVMGVFDPSAVSVAGEKVQCAF